MALSHAKDKPIAAALQSVVQKLDKPWYRRRALRVFRAPHGSCRRRVHFAATLRNTERKGRSCALVRKALPRPL